MNMPLAFIVQVFLSMLVVEFSTGIIMQLNQGGKSRPRRKTKMCLFDNRNYTVGQTWHPHLEPDGFNFCILCHCQKSGLTRCSRKKCAPTSCQGKKIPQGKCCPVCPAELVKPPTAPQKRCSYKGNHYNSGQIWEINVVKNNDRENNCAECGCHNGVVSCSIRICLALKCSMFFQRKARNSCCKECGGIPLLEEDANRGKHVKHLKGSCFKDGLYYKNTDLWNPVSSQSQMKVLQYPNCHLCSCKNSNVSCEPVACPRLNCKNPRKLNPNDCCKSCPDQTSRNVLPIIYRRVSQKKPRDTIYPNCKFGSKIYLHNTSWVPHITGVTVNLCVTCNCVLSKVKCNRTRCNNNNNGRCSSNNCSVTTAKPRVTKVQVTNTGQRDCSGRRVKVYLLDHATQKKAKSRQHSVVKIALEHQSGQHIKIYHWDISENKASIRDSKRRKSRFEKRKSNYEKLGETKYGRINRFLNKQKSLSRCRRNCKNEATRLITFLRNRVKYFKKECPASRLVDSFKSLMRPNWL